MGCDRPQEEGATAHAATADVRRLRPALPERETAVLTVIALHLCFLPWALGSMHVWSQGVSLGLALLGLVISLAPEAGAPRPAARLWRFPVFYAGAAVLVVVAVQGANPAWRYVHNESSWWLETVRHIPWLPAGIDAPFDRSNPWRALVVYLSFWLLLCTIWIGLRHRRSLEILLSVLVGNAVLLALLALAQKLSATDRIFWAYPPSNDSFVASFVYPNHASAYFNLMAAVAVGLAWRRYTQVRRRQAGLAGARLLTVAAVLCGGAVLFSFSRAAIVLLCGFVLVIGVALVARRFTSSGPPPDHPEFLPLALALAVTLAGVFGTLGAERLRTRFAPLVANPATSALSRQVATQATAEMFRSRWVWGWGAGCFRHAFPLFAQRHPAIYGESDEHRKFWEHAHNDLLQFPAELGLAGLAPVGLALVWVGLRLYQQRCWRHPLTLSGLAGAGLIVAHAAVDFVFQNPAVLLTWGTLLLILLRWPDTFVSR